MEDFNFVRDGKMALPPGFRFQPTDEELIFQYLKCKVLSRPLPASIIPELDVSRFDPWDLPGDPLRERYFFCKRGFSRASRSGTWKSTGADEIVASSRGNSLVGLKRTLIFHKVGILRSCGTRWLMSEYRLLAAGNRFGGKFQELVSVGDWVICCVQKINVKRRKVNCATSSSASSRSDLTEVDDSEEVSSG